MRTLLVVEHASWEGPHRILDACGGLEVRTVQPLAGDPLPSHAGVSGALVMGGPMNVDEVERYPGLAAEREWLAEAVERQRPGERPEIGFAPVRIDDPDDPIFGGLAPQTTALHWHGGVFDLPEGATPLASSEQTDRPLDPGFQAFADLLG